MIREVLYKLTGAISEQNSWENSKENILRNYLGLSEGMSSRISKIMRNSRSQVFNKLLNSKSYKNMSKEFH